MESAADLLFDFEDAIQSICTHDQASSRQYVGLEALARRIEFAAGRHPSELARQLHRHVIAIVDESSNMGHESTDVLRVLASSLKERGYDVSVRAALGGGNSECFKSLRHEFLVVRGLGEFTGMEFIVEPFLRQHFAVPHPSPEYEHVLSRTPNIFVGGSCRLASIVQLLSALMAESFQQQGLPLPPWRREAAMLSKWLPQPHRTRDVSPPCRAESPVSRMRTRNNGTPESPEPIPGHSSSVSPRVAPPAPPPPALPTALQRSPLPSAADAAAAAVPVRPQLGCRQTALVVGFAVPAARDTQLAEPNGESRRQAHGRTSADSRGRPTNGDDDDDDEIHLSYISDLDELDECASPCRGASGSGDDPGSSFLLGSGASEASSVHLYDTRSLLGSPIAGAAAVAAGAPPLPAPPALGCLGRLLSSLSTAASVPASASSSAGRRETGTGMLPCPCPCAGSSGLLSAKLLLEPLAASAAAAMAVVAAAASSGQAPAAPLPPASPPTPSPPFPWSGSDLSGPATPPALQTRPAPYPGAPAIHLVRRTAVAARGGGSTCAAAAGARLSQRAREQAEWLPSGLPC